VNHFHRPFNFVLLAVCGVALLTTSAFANPAEEIIRAVAASGMSDVSQASPRQFTKALNAVALRVPPRQLPEYVVAAIHLRPELAPNIVAVAIKAAVRNLEGKPEVLCRMIERIVAAGIVANPDAADWIVRASTSAAPEWRKWIVAAAIAAAPNAKEAIVEAAKSKTVPLAFLNVSENPVSGFSFSSATLNPASISDLAGDGNVNSPEQPPSR
jgi:hypothetical protein